MASGPAFKITKRKTDGTLEKEILVKNLDGSISRVTQTVFEAGGPAVPATFSEEITRLIDIGEIELPAAGISNSYIVEITDQLTAGKYTYNIVDSSGASKKASSVFRVFLDGMNVTPDVTLAANGLTFTFMAEYPTESFGYPESKLVIDFIEDSD